MWRSLRPAASRRIHPCVEPECLQPRSRCSGRLFYPLLAVERYEPTRPVLIRALAAVTSIGAGVLLFVATGHLGWHGGGATHQERQPAIHQVRHPSPWYHEFDGHAINLSSALAPFSAGRCDSQTPPHRASCKLSRHNSHGFRTHEYTIAHPPNTFRIVILGDSFTWGDGVDVEQTYHRRLQELFDATAASTAPQVEVIGLGVNGSRIWDNVTRLIAHGQFLEPDLVLLQFYNNDLGFGIYPDLLFSDVPNAELEVFLRASGAPSQFLSPLDRMLRSNDLWRAEQERVYSAESLEWRLFISALDELASWARAADIPTALTVFPAIKSGERLAATVAYDAQVLEAARLRGLQTIDLGEALSRQEEALLSVSDENGHYSGATNLLVAALLLDTLRAAAWVDLHQSPASDAVRWAAERQLRSEAEREWLAFHQSYDRQRELFLRLHALAPQNPWLINSLAFIASELQNHDECRQWYLTLADVAPDFAAPWFDLVRCVPSDDAQDLLLRMVEQVPDHVEALMGLADIDFQQGAPPRACGCLGRALQLAPTIDQYRRARSRYDDYSCSLETEAKCPGSDLRPRP